jgi:hypothetical protein
MVATGEEHHTLGSSTFTLENNTGRVVRFWLGHEQQEDFGPSWEEGQTPPTFYGASYFRIKIRNN